MRFIGLIIPALLIGVACGQSDDKSMAVPNNGGHAASAGSPGSAGAASDAGSSSGGSGSGSGGRIAMAGTAGQGSAGAGNAPGGAAGDPEEGGSGGVGGGGGVPAADPRPGCDLARLIELSSLRLVKGAGPGEAAMLEVDVTNGTLDFVSYNPLKVTCTGAAVEHASDLLGVFGINAGGTSVVQLQVVFGDAAKPGDVARCEVRGFISGRTPDDCASAQTESLDVVVQ